MLAAAESVALGLPMRRPYVVLDLMLLSKRSLDHCCETANSSSVPLAEPSSAAVCSSLPPAPPTSVTCEPSEPSSSSDQVKAWQALRTSRASSTKTTRATVILLTTYTPRPGPSSPRGLGPLCIHFLYPLSLLGSYHTQAYTSPISTYERSPIDCFEAISEGASQKRHRSDGDYK